MSAWSSITHGGLQPHPKLPWELFFDQCMYLGQETLIEEALNGMKIMAIHDFFKWIFHILGGMG